MPLFFAALALAQGEGAVVSQAACAQEGLRIAISQAMQPPDPVFTVSTVAEAWTKADPAHPPQVQVLTVAANRQLPQDEVMEALWALQDARSGMFIFERGQSTDPVLLLKRSNQLVLAASKHLEAKQVPHRVFFNGGRYMLQILPGETGSLPRLARGMDRMLPGAGVWYSPFDLAALSAQGFFSSNVRNPERSWLGLSHASIQGATAKEQNVAHEALHFVQFAQLVKGRSNAYQSSLMPLGELGGITYRLPLNRTLPRYQQKISYLFAGFNLDEQLTQRTSLYWNFRDGMLHEAQSASTIIGKMGEVTLASLQLLRPVEEVAEAARGARRARLVFEYEGKSFEGSARISRWRHNLVKVTYRVAQTGLNRGDTGIGFSVNLFVPAPEGPLRYESILDQARGYLAVLEQASSQNQSVSAGFKTGVTDLGNPTGLPTVPTLERTNPGAVEYFRRLTSPRGLPGRRFEGP